MPLHAQLGEMLVRAKAITAADLEEAIGWQVLYGGRLGTNLLELGLVDEKILADTLGRQLACESTFGEIELPQSMVQAIPGMIARRQEVVPWRIDGKRLKVLCISPQDNLALFDEIGFRLGKLVKPVVAPEFRIHQVLRRHFESVRQMRALDFGQKPKGKRQQDAERKAEQAELEKSVDLMDDEGFATLYAEAMQGRGAPAKAPAPPPPAPAPVPPPQRVAPPHASSLPPPAVGRPAPPPMAPPVVAPSGWTAPPPAARPVPPPAPPPMMAPVAALPAAPPVIAAVAPTLQLESDQPIQLTSLDGDEIVEAELVEIPDEGEGEEIISSDRWAAAFQDLETEIQANAPPPPPPRDMSPLSFPEALAHIGKASDRDEVARTVLRYARSKAARAVLLSIQGDVALGWDGAGDNITQDTARLIAFPLTVPSAFRLVRESRSHYIGPLGKDSGNVRFLKLAGKQWPSSCVMLPVLFRGKVVYILYVDNGHKQHVNADVGELLILSQNITRSMEQMVAKRQAHAKA